jgi:hypothetical protein
MLAAGITLAAALAAGSWSPGVSRPVVSAVARAAPPLTRQFPEGGPVPTNYAGRRFRLSQRYPTAKPLPVKAPWEGIDYRQPQGARRFLSTVIDYCFDGNALPDDIPNSFRVEDIGARRGDPRRRWYHAPFMHAPEPDARGREGVHGMTHERVSRPYELSRQQSAAARTYAVAFYNAPGGAALGAIWNPVLAGGKPADDAVAFPPGTVCYKLIFTTATPDKVHWLSGAPEWWCYGWVQQRDPPRRHWQNVRLLQVDVAVKVRPDGRVDAPGWIFGTLQYDGTVLHRSPWRRLTPVALTWGNGARLPDLALRPDGVKWPRTDKTWVNYDAPWVRYRIAADKPISLLGGGNGPVDDPRSSCIACHSPAYSPRKPPRGSRLFTDYSLQTAFGLANYYRAASDGFWPLRGGSNGFVPRQPDFGPEDVTRENPLPLSRR